MEIFSRSFFSKICCDRLFRNVPVLTRNTRTLYRSNVACVYYPNCCGEKSVQKPRTLPLVALICIQYMLLVCLAQDRCCEKSVQKPCTLPLVAVICIQHMLLVCLAQDRCSEKSVRKPRTLSLVAVMCIRYMLLMCLAQDRWR